MWLRDPEISLAVIPIDGDLFNATRRLRKGLRDVRDRTARQDYRFAAVTLAGLVEGDQALILIQHPAINRVELWATLERRWPQAMLGDPAGIAPSSTMTVANAAALARRRRGIAPIRIIIASQQAASIDPYDAPMPWLF